MTGGQTTACGPSPIYDLLFKIKFLLKHTHGIMYCPWLHLHYKEKLSSCDRPCGLQSLKYFLSCPLQKMYATPL